MKHFNMGNVWGRIVSTKDAISEGKNTPYLSIQLECGSEINGNVKTYGRLWGAEKIAAFKDSYKKNPSGTYRLTGFFNQYDKEEGVRYSNYTFFNWQVSEGKEFRAAFVLVGEVMLVSRLEDGDGKILLHLTHKGKGDYKDTEEDFEIYTMNSQEVDGVVEGEIIEVAGFIRAKEPEDAFGRSSSIIRPYVLEMKKRGEKEVPAEMTQQEVF